MSTNTEYGNVSIPKGIRSRFVKNNNGLNMHVLEAGFEQKGRPCILLLHGFPELAYSWRKVMPQLADAGYHVIAPDQRGYGRTTGWNADYDGDLKPFGSLNLVRDIVGLLSALGYRSVDAVFGHDAGSLVAAWCALIRPDIFQSVAMMSAPFSGVASMPFDTADGNESAPAASSDIHEEMAIPMSFLLDRENRIQVIYSGAVSVEQLLADHRALTQASAAPSLQRSPFPGRWHAPAVRRYSDIVNDLKNADLRDWARFYLKLDRQSRNR